MNIARKTLSLSLVAVLLSATAAFAQTGGGDVPSDAKAKGTMENGSSSTGMSKGQAKGDMKKEGGMMKKDGKM